MLDQDFFRLLRAERTGWRNFPVGLDIDKPPSSASYIDIQSQMRKRRVFYGEAEH